MAGDMGRDYRWAKGCAETLLALRGATQFDAVVATVMRILSSAVIELASMRAAGKL
jgi:hypothetical protein